VTLACKRPVKYISALTNTSHLDTAHGNRGAVEAMISIQSRSRLYNKDEQAKLVTRQAPSIKDLSTEAEEDPLLGAAT
jgi:hypothetical protein